MRLSPPLPTPPPIRSARALLPLPVTVAVVLAALLVPTSLGADEPLCGACQTTGRIAHEHPAFDHENETDDIEFCSVSMELDPEALGLDWVPCPKCLAPSKKEAAEREWNGLMELRKKWLADRREVDTLTKTTLMHVQTKHFVLTWGIPKIKVGKRVLKEHEAMHLYAKRLEETYQRILDLCGIDESAMVSTRVRVFMFEGLREAQIAAPVYTNNPISSGQKTNLIGAPESSLVSWDDPEKILNNDEYRHQFLVHAVSHNLWHLVREYTFWLFKEYGWVYEGLAYYMETTQFGTPLVSCGQEQIEEPNWKGKCWESNVKKALIAGKEPSVLDVMAKSADQLSPMERQFAWSYIDYLMWENPGKMDDMIRVMKFDQKPTRDALKEAYGLSMGQFIDNWTAFVRSEYSSKPFKGPKERTPKVPARPKDGAGSGDSD
ncbi:MAG: hypothetical protein KC466_02985 [Myxococcales bacterium]|nr:hypothetical protein [Myxococcales bacterium]